MRRFRTIWPLLLALALVLSGCGGDDAAQSTSPAGSEAGSGGGSEADSGAASGGAEGEPIVIGGIFDESGPTGDVGAPYAEGVRDAIDYINSNGGAGGRPIELQSQDYQYDVAVAEQLYSQYTGAGAVAILGWGTADTEALRGRVASDELPYFSGSLSEQLADPAETPYNFLVGTTYSDQLRIALKTIAEDDPEAQVAVFHNDSPFGESPLADGESYISEQGLDLGYETYPMPAGATDYVAELSRAQDQGATHIVVQNVASPSAQLARDIASQGLDIQMYCLVWCTDELFIELAGDAAEGVRGVTPWPPANVEAEGLEVIDTYLQENGSTVQEKGGHYVQGWYYATIMAEAIGRVVEAGEEVTGPAIKEALESGEEFETGVAAPLSFSAESHKGVTSASLFEVTDGAWTLVEESVEP